MDILSGIILGVVQGATEFLPISSSGHLIIAREFLGLESAYGLSVDATLHFATAFAVLLYFRKDFLYIFHTIVNWLFRGPKEVQDTELLSRKLVLALIFGTIPAVFFGLLFEGSIETVFRSTEIVAWGLIGGSILFGVAEYLSKRQKERGEGEAHISLRKGIIIGFFQALALIPGISRSGSTISGGLLLGLSRENAARFAFLLSFPIIIGAGSKSLLELGLGGLLSELGLVLIASSITAFVTGILAIHYLLRYLKNHTLTVFIVYRIALALLILFVF